MPSSQVAPVGPDDEPQSQASIPQADSDVLETPIEARMALHRKLSSQKLPGLGPVDHSTFQQEWNRVMHTATAGDAVHAAMKVVDEQQRKKMEAELDSRKMKRFNSRVALRVWVHNANEQQKPYMMNVMNSIYLEDLKKAVAKRCGLQGSKFKLIWLNLGGESVELTSQRLFARYADTMWCSRPWELHVLPEDSMSLKAIALNETAKTLFAKYDINNNGRIDKSELLTMLKDLNLSRLECSEALIQLFVQGEFDRIDFDKSEGLSLEEFTNYATSMTRWMRDELLRLSNHHNSFELMSHRTTEKQLPPVVVPPPAEGATFSMVELGHFGIRIEVPEGVLPPGTKLSLSTLAPQAISHLSSNAEGKRGEFLFSPVVRVDFPAFEDGVEPPGPEDPKQPPFAKPLTLIMPHCFDKNEGEESCVVLGVPHGGTEWEAIHGVRTEIDTQVDHLQLVDNEMRLMIPYAGIFCGFSHPDIEDICMVRCWLFCQEELPRDDDSALRVHLCPELPEQIDTMKVSARGCEPGRSPVASSVTAQSQPGCSVESAQRLAQRQCRLHLMRAAHSLPMVRGPDA